MKYIIDAEGKRIGRVATEAAVLLMGKNRVDFARNKIPEVTVEIKNTAKALVAENKKEQAVFSRYSGYPGGLKQTNMKMLIDKKGYSEVFKIAVFGMLPKNRLRNKMIHNLIVTE